MQRSFHAEMNDDVGTANGPVDGRRVIQGPFEMMVRILRWSARAATSAGWAASVSGKWQATW